MIEEQNSKSSQKFSFLCTCKSTFIFRVIYVNIQLTMFPFNFYLLTHSLTFGKVLLQNLPFTGSKMVFTLWLLHGFAWLASGADQWNDIGSRITYPLV
jgi:hypothetical protein